MATIALRNCTEHSGTDIKEQMRQIWAWTPMVAEAIAKVQEAINSSSTLTPRLRELLRLRIAYHNQCRTCMAVRYVPEVTEDLICSLESPSEAPDLTEGERAALHFVDLFAGDHLAIDDSVYDSLRAFYTEGQLVELGTLAAFFVGIGRLTATWKVIDGLPDEFRIANEEIVPWGHEGGGLRLYPGAGGTSSFE